MDRGLGQICRQEHWTFMDLVLNNNSMEHFCQRVLIISRFLIGGLPFYMITLWSITMGCRVIVISRVAEDQLITVAL